jgi:hypothetical protein
MAISRDSSTKVLHAMACVEAGAVYARCMHGTLVVYAGANELPVSAQSR